MIRSTAFLCVFLFSILHCSAQAGSLDSTFGVNGKVTSPVGSDFDVGHSVAIQADGKLVVAGWSDNGTDDDMSLIRYNTDGSVDSTFGVNGRVITVVGIYGSHGEALEIQSDGKIVVGGFGYSGSYSDFALVRYNTNGTLDNTFGSGGILITTMGSSSDCIYDIAIQSDGKIVAVGTRNMLSPNTTQFGLARFNTNGTLDPTFGTNGKVFTTFGIDNQALSVAIQSDGKIVVGGQVYLVAQDSEFGLVRYNTDGSLDTTFGGTGMVATPVAGNYDEPENIALQTDGKILTVGSIGFSTSRRVAVTRHNTDGSVDSTFGVNGVVITSFGNLVDARGRDLFLQPDGKIVVSGGCAYSSALQSFALARYKSDGSLDSTFGTNGKVTTAMGNYTAFGFATLLQPDGKIVVAGDNYNGTDNDFAIARYHGAQTNVNATRCGRIWYDCPGGNVRTFHIEIHIDGFPVSTDSLYVDYGNSITNAMCVTAFTQCDTFPGYCVLYFDFSQTYSPGNYSMIVKCGKHIPGIANIPNSATVDFCLLTEFVIDPNIGCNSSPISDSLNLEIDWGTGQMNVVNMHVWDPDGDSISWNLISPTCLQSGYIAPQIAGGGTFSFSQPAETVSWNLPTNPGTYTAVFLFEEWVTTSTTTVIAGVTTREVIIEMQSTLSVPSPDEQQFTLYPNPAADFITVNVLTEGEVKITDITGKTVLTENSVSEENTIDVSFLATGIYIMSIDGKSSQKIVIAR